MTSQIARYLANRFLADPHRTEHPTARTDATPENAAGALRIVRDQDAEEPDIPGLLDEDGQ